jgi:hypothetical protein
MIITKSMATEREVRLLETPNCSYMSSRPDAYQIALGRRLAMLVNVYTFQCWRNESPVPRLDMILLQPETAVIRLSV